MSAVITRGRCGILRCKGEQHMKQRKVIDTSQLPARLPVVATAVAYLLLDKFHAPGWVWGILGIVWIGIVVDLFHREEIKLKELL